MSKKRYRASPESIARMRSARDALASELGRAPSLADIGRRLGVSREWVRQICDVAGDPSDRRRCEMLAKAQIARAAAAERKSAREALYARMLELDDEGIPQREIARQLGCANSQVCRAIRRLRRSTTKNAG